MHFKVLAKHAIVSGTSLCAFSADRVDLRDGDLNQ